MKKVPGSPNGSTGRRSSRRRTSPQPTLSCVLSTSDRVLALLAQAKRIAKEYRALTGRPLGIVGEVAEFEAARLLRLELADPRQAGYDAIRRERGRRVRLEIKGRCLLPGCTPEQRLGRIQLDRDWDAALMVLMDADFEAIEIYEAGRTQIEAALTAPGSRARNERGQLPVKKFKSIGKQIWRRDSKPL